MPQRKNKAAGNAVPLWSGGAAMSCRVRLRFRLRGRLRFRQRVRLRFPALCVPLGLFPCTFAGFVDDCAADISVSAGECPGSRSLTGDPAVLCLAGRAATLRLPLATRLAAIFAVRSGRRPVVTLRGAVPSADRVVAGRRRCLAAPARLASPAAFPVLRCLAVRGCTVQPSLSRRLPGRWCNGPRAARRRSGGAR